VMKIEVGDVFSYRHNGKHEDSNIVVLYDHDMGKRYLYNLDYKVRIGDHHLLYAKFTEKKISKEEINQISNLSETIYLIDEPTAE